MREDDTRELVDEGEARQQLNDILDPIDALPSTLLVPLRERLLAKHATDRDPADASDADTHRANFKVGQRFVAFRDDEVKGRLAWIAARLGFLAARSGDVDPDVFVDAAELMYEFAELGVLLTVEQGLVLDALRSAPAPWAPAEVADAISARGVGLTDVDAERLLGEVRAALDTPGRPPYVVEQDGRWRSERV